LVPIISRSTDEKVKRPKKIGENTRHYVTVGLECAEIREWMRQRTEFAGSSEVTRRNWTAAALRRLQARFFWSSEWLVLGMMVDFHVGFFSFKFFFASPGKVSGSFRPDHCGWPREIASEGRPSHCPMLTQRFRITLTGMFRSRID
jgi:hypothetical protein